MKSRVAQLHQSGATDGQFIYWDNAAGYYKTRSFSSARDLTTAYVPLSTDIAGVPELVWDAGNNIVLTEVPIP